MRYQAKLLLLLIVLALVGGMHFFPSICIADGKVFSSIYFTSEPSTPLQEAVIIHDGKTEHMILQVNFDGEGNDFAWVVPVPAKPEITQENPEIFSVLKKRSKPYVVSSRKSQMTKAWLFPLVMAIIYIGILFIRRLPPGDLRDVAFFIMPIIIIIVVFLFSGFVTSMSKSFGDEKSWVIVEEEKLVGIYKTATLSASGPQELIDWLNKNKYRVSEGAEEVFKHYIDKKWHFVAIKLATAEKEKVGTDDKLGKTPPLGFKFKSENAVFPLKITSLSNEESLVILYVFSSGYAVADGFKLIFAAIFSLDQYTPSLELSTPLPTNTYHFTALWAKLRPNQMEDIIIDTDREVEYSYPIQKYSYYIPDYIYRATYYTQEVKYITVIGLVVCILALVLIWVTKSHLVWKIIFSALIILGGDANTNPKSLVTSGPFEYTEKGGHGKVISDFE